MPNWCHNVLTVSGAESEVTVFVEKARPTMELKKREYEDMRVSAGAEKPPLEQWFADSYRHQPLTFEAFAPQPPDVDWHSWRVREWGTKWDAHFGYPGPALGDPDADLAASLEANGLVATPTVLVYRFETAWTPPIEAVEAMVAQHPELAFRLRYGEPGEGHAGEMTFVDGELEEDVTLDIDDVLAPEEMWF
jgi:hypothetical protein